MALLSGAGAWGLITLILWVLGPTMATWPLPRRTCVLSVLMSLGLTLLVIPYLTRIFAASSVPDELLEASRIDGAGEIRTFFTVSIRLMTPALVTVFLFQFVAIWNNFFLPLIMLRSEELFPVTFGLYTWNSQLNQIPELRAYVLVGALLSIIPLIVTFLLLQRFWRSGLGAGSLK